MRSITRWLCTCTFEDRAISVTRSHRLTYVKTRAIYATTRKAMENLAGNLVFILY